ncbi:hypothetical protein HAX54_034682, partial [Datura stramonium]|nr:hypothetical protein [Datura stramonium]
SCFDGGLVRFLWWKKRGKEKSIEKREARHPCCGLDGGVHGGFAGGVRGRRQIWEGVCGCSFGLLLLVSSSKREENGDEKGEKREGRRDRVYGKRGGKREGGPAAGWFWTEVEEKRIGGAPLVGEGRKMNELD